VGQWLVRKQAPEYTGAAQKAFAWAIGFVLSLLMFYLMVLNQHIGPLNLVVCGVCLILMWFETSAGICIGCKMYNFFAKDPAQLCPGNTCAYAPLAGAGGHWRQGIAVLVYCTVLLFAGKFLLPEEDANMLSTSASSAASTSDSSATTSAVNAAKNTAEIARCTVPEFAKKIGHETMWKKHNNCN
jgi:hypothetical protein